MDARTIASRAIAWVGILGTGFALGMVASGLLFLAIVRARQGAGLAIDASLVHLAIVVPSLAGGVWASYLDLLLARGNARKGYPATSALLGSLIVLIATYGAFHRLVGDQYGLLALDVISVPASVVGARYLAMLFSGGR